jgi:hypothetical protein
MSEAARLSRKLCGIQQSCNNAAILAARAMYGGSPCGACDTVVANPAQQTPAESDYLNAKVATCFSGVIGTQPTTEGVRILDLITRTLDASVDPLDPDARFSQYRGPFIPPVCPPIPTSVRNANIPKQSLNRCPLPNKGFMPNLPA